MSRIALDSFTPRASNTSKLAVVTGMTSLPVLAFFSGRRLELHVHSARVQDAPVHALPPIRTVYPCGSFTEVQGDNCEIALQIRSGHMHMHASSPGSMESPTLKPHVCHLSCGLRHIYILLACLRRMAISTRSNFASTSY
jgi:hypothetical protein